MTEMSGRRYAVLIASSQYPDESKLQDLRCPEKDVDGLNEILTSKVHGEFTQTFVLKNRPHHEVMLKVNKVLKQAAKNDLVLVYYSGHGKLDLAGRLHLATVNTVVDALEATSIPVASLTDYIGLSPSTKVILILDCCFSGAVGKLFQRSGIDDQLQLASGGRGTYIMTASTGIQVAQERESDEYGIFTKHIIEGIKGGEADRDEDGLVSVGELYSYVHDRVLEEGFQEPMKWDLNVRGELVVARTGKSPREERRRQMRGMLLDLKGILPDRILSKAIYVIALTPTECVGELRSYYDLVERLFQKRLEVGEFLEEWSKVKLKPSARASEEKQVPQAKSVETEQQPTPEQTASNLIVAKAVERGRRGPVALIILGYLFLLLYGLSGIVIGIRLWTAKVRIDDTVYLVYDERSRKHGAIMIVLGSVCLVISVIFIIWVTEYSSFPT